MSRLSPLVLLFIVPLTLLSCSPEPEADISDLERRVTNVLRLHSYEHVYRDIVYFGEERTFLFFKTMDRRLLFSVDIVVRAGVDLAEGIEVLTDRGNPERVVVRLPPTRILRVDADEATIHQYFSRTRGGDVGWLEYGAEIEGVKERVRADAIERGILAKAQDNAREMVENFFTIAGFEEVVFRPAAGYESGDGLGDGEIRG
ncbi:MAG: DUF4230 domain-containing protein [Spirochaetia bacterium]